MGDLRSNQLVGVFGPGAIYDLVDYSVIIASADQWLSRKFDPELVIDDIEIKQVVQKRMQELTSHKIPYIYGLMMPPLSREDSDEHETAKGSVKAFRFPIFHRCSRCKVLCRLKNTSTERYCTHKHSLIPGMEPCASIPQEWKRGRLEPVRFVTKCEDGHLQDFNWITYKQLTCKNEKCLKHDRWGPPESIYYLDETSQGDFFNSIKINCRSCKSSSSLGRVKKIIEIIKNDGFDKLDPKEKSIFSCNGWRPWLEGNETESCNRTLDFVPRGQSNVYIPVRESYISIPKDDFTDLDINHDEILGTLFFDDDPSKQISKEEAIDDIPNAKRFRGEEIKQAIIKNLGDQSEEELNRKVDQYFHDLINWRVSCEEISADEIEKNYKFNELRSLSSEVVSDEFICHPVDISGNDFLKVKFQSISKIEKLKIVNSLLGFQRSFNADDDEIKFHPSINKPSYIPSSISWGEGIFMEFRIDEIEKWAQANKTFIEKRDKELRLRSVNSLQKKDIKNTKYSMVHTFSHMFMKQLAYESGFSVTELTEKIYFFEAEAKIGLLIHTTSGDAQCSMGGLSDLADPSKLESTIKRALNINLSCSNDPLCADSSGQGTSALSHAACFGCLMLPEICCEVRPIKNSYLDRNLLIPISDDVVPFF